MRAVMRSNASLVISMESLRVGQQGEVAVHDWDGLVTGGEAHVEDAKARGLSMTREDLACLIYPSGTGGAPRRSEERRVGQGGGSTSSLRWSPCPLIKTTANTDQ